MGGFLAGTGWLLAGGGLSVMTGTPFGREWFTPAVLVHWLPGARHLCTAGASMLLLGAFRLFCW
jgi:hypothetical protein